MIHGLLPATIRSIDNEIRIAFRNLSSLPDNVSKYDYLQSLNVHNNDLFRHLLKQKSTDLIPILMTPPILSRYSELFQLCKIPHGLFLTIEDMGKIDDILSNWNDTTVRLVIITDGENVYDSNATDYGSHAMSIITNIGSICSTFGGIDSRSIVPIMIDFGTNNQSLINDPYYIGLRHQRTINNEQYHQFIDELIHSIVQRWSYNCLIMFDDLNCYNSWKILFRYRRYYSTFNNDIQSFGAAIVAGILAGLNITQIELTQNRFLLCGDDIELIGAAHLLIIALKMEGLTHHEALGHIALFDSNGLITNERTNEEFYKQMFSKFYKPFDDLLAIVNQFKPTVLIGSSPNTNGSLFNRDILRRMATFNERPIIFSLRSECTAVQAYQHTEGRALFASGQTQYAPVALPSSIIYHPSRCCDYFIYPAIVSAIVHCNVHYIPNDAFLAASIALSRQVSIDDLMRGSLYPSLDNLDETMINVATSLVQWFYVRDLSYLKPEPIDKYEFLKQQWFET